MPSYLNRPQIFLPKRNAYQSITTSIGNLAEMSGYFAAMQQHNAYTKTGNALPEIGVRWVLFEKNPEEIGIKLREQHLDTTHSKIRPKSRKRAIVEKSQQVVGCTQKLKAIVKIPKKNGRERGTAPARFAIQNFLTHFVRFEPPFFSRQLNAAFVSGK